MAYRYSPVEDGVCERCGCGVKYVKHGKSGYILRKYCDDCRYIGDSKVVHDAKVKKAVVSHRRALKAKGVEYLGGRCSVCGYDKSLSALEFHHKDPKKKDRGIKLSSNTMSWERMKRELDKCVLLCSNCHAEAHDRMRNCPVA